MAPRFGHHVHNIQIWCFCSREQHQLTRSSRSSSSLCCAARVCVYVCAAHVARRFERVVPISSFSNVCVEQDAFVLSLSLCVSAFIVCMWMMMSVMCVLNSNSKRMSFYCTLHETRTCATSYCGKYNFLLFLTWQVAQCVMYMLSLSVCVCNDLFTPFFLWNTDYYIVRLHLTKTVQHVIHIMCYYYFVCVTIALKMCEIIIAVWRRRDFICSRHIVCIHNNNNNSSRREQEGSHYSLSTWMKHLKRRWTHPRTHSRVWNKEFVAF